MTMSATASTELPKAEATLPRLAAPLERRRRSAAEVPLLARLNLLHHLSTRRISPCSLSPSPPTSDTSRTTRTPTASRGRCSSPPPAVAPAGAPRGTRRRGPTPWGCRLWRRKTSGATRGSKGKPPAGFCAWPCPRAAGSSSWFVASWKVPRRCQLRGPRSRRGCRSQLRGGGLVVVEVVVVAEGGETGAEGFLITF